MNDLATIPWTDATGPAGDGRTSVGTRRHSARRGRDPDRSVWKKPCGNWPRCRVRRGEIDLTAAHLWEQLFQFVLTRAFQTRALHVPAQVATISDPPNSGVIR